jgi:hypothetical protein
LEMFGGKRSLIVNSKNICRYPGKAIVRMGAHNGRRFDHRLRVASGCSKKARGKRGKGKAGGKGARGKRR